MSGVEKPQHRLVIIGAGLTGLGTASAMLRAGIEDFIVVDRSDDVGGTWHQNTYPGVGVDVPTLSYQFPWDIKPDWSRLFASGTEVKEYIDDYVEKFGLRSHVRLDTEVMEQVWDEPNHLWRLRIADGSEITTRFVFTALSPFVEPKPDSIPGTAEFTGKLLRSMKWDHDYDLRGKRVAVIGTGASSVQITPAIASEVDHLDVYQRTPIWIVPKVDPKFPRWFQKLLARPRAGRLMYDTMVVAVELTLVRVIIDYAHSRWLQRLFERICRLELRRAVKDPETRRRLTPAYPFGCKRPSLSNSYYQTFNRQNVGLVTDPIDQITEHGIRTAGGEERVYDAIVLATGFLFAWDAQAYEERRVRGHDGFDLAEHLAAERVRAYEGLTRPGLPNYFISFSAYSGVGGSWHPLVKTTSKHAVRVLTEAQRRGATRVEIRPEALDEFHTMVTERMVNNITTVLDCSGANTRYLLDRHGDSPPFRPTSTGHAVKASRTFPLDDYAYSRVDTAGGDGAAGEPAPGVDDREAERI